MGNKDLSKTIVEAVIDTIVLMALYVIFILIIGENGKSSIEFDNEHLVDVALLYIPLFSFFSSWIYYVIRFKISEVGFWTAILISIIFAASSYFFIYGDYSPELSHADIPIIAVIVLLAAFVIRYKNDSITSFARRMASYFSILALFLFMSSCQTEELTGLKGLSTSLKKYSETGNKFQNGLLPVKNNKGKWGYIDMDGKEVIKCFFDRVEPFSSNGYAAVYDNIIDEWMFLNKSTKEARTIPGYKILGGFSSDGYARVTNRNSGLRGLVNSNLELIVPCLYDDIPVLQDSKSFFTADGISSFSVKDEHYENEGMIMVIRDRKWGFANSVGNEVIPCEYSRVQGFSGGFALVTNYSLNSLVNSNGDIVDLTFEPVKYYSEGIIQIYDERKWSLLNVISKQRVECEFTQMYPFRNGIAIVSNGEKWGCINQSGSTLIPCIYESITTFSEGFCAIKFQGKYGFVDESGKRITPFVYDDVQWFCNGLVAAKKNGKWGYVDSKGREVISFIYDSAYDFSDGLAKVVKDSKIGFVNTHGVSTFDVNK